MKGRFDLSAHSAATLGMARSCSRSSSPPRWAGPRRAPSRPALVVAVVFLALFVVNEARAAQPIMPLHLFSSRVRTGAYLARMLYLGAMIGFFFFTTQYLQGVLGYSPLQAGVAFFPMTVVNFVVALAIPRLTRRVGNAALLAAGVLTTLVGMAWLSRSTPTAPTSRRRAADGPHRRGQGLAFAPLTAAGIGGVTRADAGAASGVVNTAHQLGSASGSASGRGGRDGSGGELRRSAAGRQVSAALTAGSVLLFLALAVTVALILPADLAARRDAGQPRRGQWRWRGPRAEPSRLTHHTRHLWGTDMHSHEVHDRC